MRALPLLLAGVLGASLVSGAGHPAAASSRPQASLVVVAVLGETGGVNVLHQDFRTADGATPGYPVGMPRPVMVALPHGGDFASERAALERGPLGHLAPGVLYGVAGTRLLLVNTGTGPYDGVQADALHATGVADSITGARQGTAPHALVVVVLSNQEAGYPWLAANASWVDLASTSVYRLRTAAGPVGDTAATRQCTDAEQVRSYTAAGHLLFSSAGNTTDQAEPLVAPNGLPETYVVGGVDSSGSTWSPGHPEEPDPFYAAGNVVRPYETGERFSYQAAAPDSLTALTHFGGTSGAAPLTAGWAADLVAHARAVLGNGQRHGRGSLAEGPRRPARGPLADGRFTNGELRDLLHLVAVQHSGQPAGAAYAVEGYGALNGAAINVAHRILDGTTSVAPRQSDDQVDTAVRRLRATAFARC